MLLGASHHDAAARDAGAAYLWELDAPPSIDDDPMGTVGPVEPPGGRGTAAGVGNARGREPVIVCARVGGDVIRAGRSRGP